MNASISVLLERKGSAVQCLAPAASVAEAVQLMNRSKISSVLITEGGRLAGIFTERDVLRRVVGESRDPKTTPVSLVMTAGVATITAGATIDEALALFTSRRCRHLPVLEAGRLVGLISIGDISRWLAEAHRTEAEHLKNYISGGLQA